MKNSKTKHFVLFINEYKANIGEKQSDRTRRRRNDSNNLVYDKNKINKSISRPKNRLLRSINLK